jgi:hypothetical protein
VATRATGPRPAPVPGTNASAALATTSPIIDR